MKLSSFDMELVQTGLALVIEQARSDKDRGQVARDVARDASKLRQKLRRFEPGAYIITAGGSP